MKDIPQVPKEPWRAAFLGSIIPGLGHLYAGSTLRGALWLAAFLAPAVSALALFFALVYVPSLRVTAEELRLLRMLLVVAALLYFYSIADGFTAARSFNARLGRRSPRGGKDAWCAVLLSRFVPGLGEIYNGRPGRGILFAAAWAGLVLLLRGSWLFAVASVPAVASVFDAWHGAARREKAGLVRSLGFAGAILIGIVVALPYLPWHSVAEQYLYRIHRITGGAMQPAILPGDRVIIDKFLFRLTGIRRGDVAAFNCPDRPGRFYVKRIVGLPGETLEIRRGKILINGKPLETGGPIDAIPYLNYGPYGREHQVIPIQEASYYFLGDRLRESYDSRLYGPIPRAEIVGRVVKIILPGRRAGEIDR